MSTPLLAVDSVHINFGLLKIGWCVIGIDYCFTTSMTDSTEETSTSALGLAME